VAESVHQFLPSFYPSHILKFTCNLFRVAKIKQASKAVLPGVKLGYGERHIWTLNLVMELTQISVCDLVFLCSNRSAAFLNLVKLTKSLADAEMTIKLRPTWEKVLSIFHS
jgi:hypothetical protein